MFYHEQWPLFYEDNHLLVVYKPAGLIMQRDIKNKANMLDLAKMWIKARYAKPGNVFMGMVHRLDAPVAGVVVMARTSKAAARLSEQFRSGRITKQYLAVVQGRPGQKAARLENTIVRQGRLSRLAPPQAPGGQKAVLHYHLLAHTPGKSLVRITLETGRRHQIRVQMAGLGCPIMGDTHYGADSGMPQGRIALLAHCLAFDHPVQGARLTFETPMPLEWPWPVPDNGRPRPLWTIEAFEKTGLTLPRWS